MKKTYYINVQGGTGLNVSLAQYVTALKAKKPEYEFFVMSPYFDIFQSCEAVEDVYQPNQAREFLFDAKDKDAKIITTRLYDLSDFIYKRLNYAQAWDELFDNELFNGEHNVEPSSLSTELKPLEKFPNLKGQVAEMLQNVKDRGYENFVIMQFYGGQSPLIQVPLGEKEENGKKVQFPDWSKVPYNGDNEPLQRHIPRDVAAKFIKEFQETHPKTAVVLFQLPNEPGYENTISFVVPYLAYYEFAKLPECRGFVAIDSCLHHLLAGITKGVVIWGHSEPEAFGYSYQRNIVQKCRRDDIIYMSLLGPCANKISYIKPEELLKEVDDELFGIVEVEAKEEK